MNDWVLQSLQEIEMKSAKSKNSDPNTNPIDTSKEGKDLFRLLAVLYRTRYPLRRLPVEIDEDIIVKL